MNILSTRTIAQVIVMSRELSRAEAELRALIDRLAQDEQAELVALMWIGRGSFEPEDFAGAFETALAEASTPCADYLIGTPHLPDHLENGLDALGISATEEEDAVM